MYESIRLWTLSIWANLVVAYVMWQETVDELLGDGDDNWPHGGAVAA